MTIIFEVIFNMVFYWLKLKKKYPHYTL